DGFQIRTLILAMFYRLAPTLIREGYTYIAESPLYEISDGKTTHFAYSDSEKNETVQKLGSKRVQVKRSKGLGENDPEMMWLTTMNPETRKLIRVVPEDVKRTAEFFDLLLGDNLAGRKQFISDFGSNYMDLVDVS
ncbi:MAG: DNA topoisomerase, partial [Clostridiales bacterium]|nr:DNA topoisomerase [Clostridiales bacterium]